MQPALSQADVKQSRLSGGRKLLHEVGKAEQCALILKFKVVQKYSLQQIKKIKEKYI